MGICFVKNALDNLAMLQSLARAMREKGVGMPVDAARNNGVPKRDCIAPPFLLARGRDFRYNTFSFNSNKECE